MNNLFAILALAIGAACFLGLGYWLGRRDGIDAARLDVRERFHSRLFDGDFNAYVTYVEQMPPGDMLRFIDAIRPFVERCEQEDEAKRQAVNASASSVSPAKTKEQ